MNKFFALLVATTVFVTPAYSQTLIPPGTSSGGGGCTTNCTVNTLVTDAATIASTSAGKISQGSLGYTDVGLAETLVGSFNGVQQAIIQNNSAGTTASANWIVGNGSTTATTFYGEFGMNSSGFTGTGAFNQPSYVYLDSASSDIAIGTLGANAIHFVVNNGATDAATISSSGGLTLNNTLTYGGVALSNSVTGTGSMVLATSPSFTTPSLGAATASTLNVGGGTLGSNLFVVGAGTSSFGGALTVTTGAINTTAGNIAAGYSLIANTAVFPTSASKSQINSSADQSLSFADHTGSADVDTLYIPSSATWEFGGSDAASPTAQTFQVQSVVGGTSQTSGPNFTISGSKGTGTSGLGGNIIFQTATAGTGTTVQGTPTTALTLFGGTQNATFGGSITTVPAGSTSAPGLVGSTSNTGLSMSSTLNFVVAGTNRFLIGTNLFSGNATGAGGVNNVTASGTVPTILPNHSDTTSGVGQNSTTGHVTLVAGSTDLEDCTTSGCNFPVAIQANSQVLFSNTAPSAFSAGLGSTTSLTYNSGSGAFAFTIGGTGITSTGTITMPAASHGWICKGQDNTTNLQVTTTGALSTTTPTITIYNMAGTATAPTSGDVISMMCHAL